MEIKHVGDGSYLAVIPENVTPGSYRILIWIVDAGGRHVVYETGHDLDIEEYQGVEELGNYVRIVPLEGGNDPERDRTLFIRYRAACGA